MQTPKLRWGILSTARIADSLVSAIKLSTNGELVAVASRSLDLAQAWATQRDVPHAFGSYEEMLTSNVIDAVYIPLPNALHKEWSIKAMQQGKHVLCEKPLAANAADVQKMIEVSESSGVKLMEAFMYRFHPATAKLVELIDKGAIGDPKMIRASFGFHLGDPNDIRWSADLAGGSIMDVGCYCVNVARLLAGTEPLAVTARAVWTSSGVDESIAGTLEFPGGLFAALDSSFVTGPSQQSLSISGTNGRIIVSQPFRRAEEAVDIIIDRADTIDYASQKEIISVPGAFQYALMAQHFADAVLHDHPVDYTPQNSLGNMQVIDALKESARSGRAVVPGSN